MGFLAAAAGAGGAAGAAGAGAAGAAGAGAAGAAGAGAAGAAGAGAGAAGAGAGAAGAAGAGAAGGTLGKIGNFASGIVDGLTTQAGDGLIRATGLNSLTGGLSDFVMDAKNAASSIGGMKDKLLGSAINSGGGGFDFAGAMSEAGQSLGSAIEKTGTSIGNAIGDAAEWTGGKIADGAEWLGDTAVKGAKATGDFLDSHLSGDSLKGHGKSFLDGLFTQDSVLTKSAEGDIDWTKTMTKAAGRTLQSRVGQRLGKLGSKEDQEKFAKMFYDQLNGTGGV